MGKDNYKIIKDFFEHSTNFIEGSSCHFIINTGTGLYNKYKFNDDDKTITLINKNTQVTLTIHEVIEKYKDGSILFHMMSYQLCKDIL